MHKTVIPEMVSIMERDLDRSTAERLAAIPVDSGTAMLRDRLRNPFPMSAEEWAPVGSTVWRIVRERDPGSIIIEEPDSTDEGGPTLDDTWWAAMFAVTDAALAYSAPDRLAPHERDLMVDRWESVFGRLPPST